MIGREETSFKEQTNNGTWTSRNSSWIQRFEFGTGGIWPEPMSSRFKGKIV